MKTQLDRIIQRISQVGYVDNGWCFHDGGGAPILRLSERIRELLAKGWSFDKKFGHGANKKNYHYYLKSRPVVQEQLI